MGSFVGLNNNNDQKIDISWFTAANFKPGETGNSVVMYGGIRYSNWQSGE